MSKRCPKCGYSNPDGVDVCAHCAAPLERTCHSCGFENPPNFKFCGNCGASLQTPAPVRATSEETRQRLQSSIPAELAEKISRVGKQIEGQRRTVTVLFADISGFTAIAEKLDPEEVYNLIDGTLRAFTLEIFKREGTLDKFLGDGVMALFGAPVAHEDDPARAVWAALGMQSELRRIDEELESRLGISVKARIGLNSGPVVVGSIGSDLSMTYTALGDTVNVASRLQNVAEPGAILVSRPIYEQTEPLFEFRELGSIRVKGRLEPVEIFEVVAPRQTASRVRGIPGLTAPMVGRRAEFERLLETVEDLDAKRRGRIVLITGDAGIGKSRLTAEFKSALADKPVSIVEGACLSYGQSAYGVFLSLMKSYFQIGENEPESTARDKIERTVREALPKDKPIAHVLPYIENLLSIHIVEKELAERVRHLQPAQLQQQTFLAVRDLFSAQALRQPLILIFEDIHWIDKLSLDLLTFLLPAVEQAPLLLYFNSRLGEGPAAFQIQQAGEESFGPSFLHIPLQPLSHADVVALIDLLLTIAELPEHLKQLIPQRAEGNPFYLEETIRMLIDRGVIRRSEGRWQIASDADVRNLDVPRTLEGLIMARVDHLSEGARLAVQYASVIGRDFTLRLLSAVEDNARNLAEDIQELEERELIRPVDAEEPEFRFYHLLIQETVYNSLLLRRRERLHHKIAEGMERLFRDRLEDHIEQLAFHYAESKDAERALPYLTRAGKRAADRFANDEALRYYRTAAESLVKANPTVEQRIEVYEGLGQVQNFAGDYDGAINSYRLALELIRTAATPQRPRASAEIMRRIGRVFEWRGDNAEALRWLESALSELNRDPNSDRAVERIRIYNDISWVHYRRGQSEEAYQWRMRSLQIVEGSDHYNEMAASYNGLAALFRAKGDWARSTAYTEKALRLREAIGDSYGVSQSQTNLGVIAAEQCNWDEALDHFERSLTTKQNIGDVAGISLLNNNLGWIWREKGDYARAKELCLKGLQIAEKIKNRTYICIALNNLANIEIQQECFDSAVPFLTQSIQIASEMGSKEHLAEAEWLSAEAHLGLKDLDQANQFALHAAGVASEAGTRLLEGQALRTLAKISRARQEWTAAEDYVRRSMAICTELKNPFELARSQHLLALVQRDRGQWTEARAGLENALSTFVRLGAEGERRRTEADLDGLAASTPSTTG
ncbi:MAG: tetratricopeptide repeat protein [Chloroflexi bacterium]|nr:tetratricopeptide repeat protein [Chloroflexota bacterium]